MSDVLTVTNFVMLFAGIPVGFTCGSFLLAELSGTLPVSTYSFFWLTWLTD